MRVRVSFMIWFGIISVLIQQKKRYGVYETRVIPRVRGGGGVRESLTSMGTLTFQSNLIPNIETISIIDEGFRKRAGGFKAGKEIPSNMFLMSLTVTRENFHTGKKIINGQHGPK